MCYELECWSRIQSPAEGRPDEHRGSGRAACCGAARRPAIQGSPFHEAPQISRRLPAWLPHAVVEGMTGACRVLLRNVCFGLSTLRPDRQTPRATLKVWPTPSVCRRQAAPATFADPVRTPSGPVRVCALCWGAGDALPACATPATSIPRHQMHQALLLSIES